MEAVERRADNDQLDLIVQATGRIRAGDELFLDDALVVDCDDPAEYP